MFYCVTNHDGNQKQCMPNATEAKLKLNGKFHQNFNRALSQLLLLIKTKLKVNLDQNKQGIINLAPYLSVTALLLSSLHEEENPWHWWYILLIAVCDYTALSNFISQ